MAMSKKHYVAIAKAIRAERIALANDGQSAGSEALGRLVLALAREFRADNPAFRHDTFTAACSQ